MSKLIIMVHLWIVTCLAASNLNAQGPTIMHIQPDIAAPGMTVALEILAHTDSSFAFGQDGIAPPGLSIELVNAIDDQRIVVGVPVVSWSGRVIHVPFFIRSNAFFGPVQFRVVRGSVIGNIKEFTIRQAESSRLINGSVTLGDGALGGTLSKSNTLLFDGLSITGELGNFAKIEAEHRDPDPSVQGNPRLLPMTILSLRPIRFTNAEFHFEGRGKHGAPGGGGGGSGFEGTGGYGYTGGGSSTATSDSNQGAGTEPTVEFGGSAPTGARGGVSDVGDQGGGGGTGHPFGRGGESGNSIGSSKPGGFGGGSAGGESQDIRYGGGGGAFAANATAGEGTGNNAGNRTGGRLLIPLAGGSGGGAGNSQDVSPAGNGGGGGGALSIISFDSLLFSNTTVLIRGDSGTTGLDNSAGGGGGSGGGFVASSNVSIRANALRVDASGGVGGGSMLNGLAGGAGSIGLSRFDGVDTCLSCDLRSDHRTSLSQRKLPQQTSTTIVVEGWAGSGDGFSDDIRIYYRNTHSNWVSVDTVAYTLNGKCFWKKTIPALNDSLLFVSAFQRINVPRSGAFDAEPAWISTHVSHQIVRTQSRAQLSMIDSVIFPDTKIGRCSDTTIVIRNLGEAPLELRSIDIADPFSATITPVTIEGYSSTTVTLTYCPESDCDDSTALIKTNVGDKAIVLIGCGVETDESIQISPVNVVRFNGTRVGECDVDSVIITSIGTDSVTIKFDDLFDPPFSIDTTGKRSRLAPNQAETFLIRFCPTDSGLFFDTTAITGLDSTIYVQGKGLRTILAKRDTVIDDDICLNYERLVEDTIYNRGNDVIHIDSIGTSSPQLRPMSVPPSRSIPPGGKQIFQFLLEPSSVSQFEYRAQYFYRGDSIAIGRFRFVANLRSVTVQTADFYACAEEQIEQSIDLTNLGNQQAGITVAGVDAPFALLSSAAFDMLPGSTKLMLRFSPPGVGTFVDTLQITVRTKGCGDTVISVAVIGHGTKDRLVFSKLELDFGDVKIDECKEDSIFITNVCGPSDDVVPQALPQDRGFKTSLIVKRSIATGEGIWVIYEFCPTKTGPSEAVHRIVTLDGTAVDIVLKGSGIASDDLVSYVRMTDASVFIGQQTTTSLVIDSISGSVTELAQLRTWIAFDPSLVRLLEVETLGSSTLSIDTTRAGLIDLALSGDLTIGERVRFHWTGLLGSSAIAHLTLDSARITPSGQVQLTSGQISLADCFGLAGKIHPGGVEVAVIRPQPVVDRLSVAIRSKNEVRGRLSVRDAMGRVVQSLPLDLHIGDQVVYLETSEFSAGAYWIDIFAAGFRHSQAFWLK